MNGTKEVIAVRGMELLDAGSLDIILSPKQNSSMNGKMEGEWVGTCAGRRAC